jgi:hypothetical protein
VDLAVQRHQLDLECLVHLVDPADLEVQLLNHLVVLVDLADR